MISHVSKYPRQVRPTRKILAEISPLALAMPTMTPVRTTRLFSEIELLEYQVDSKTEGVLDPMQRRKHALRKSLLKRYDTFEMTKNLQICNAFIVEDVYGAQDNETYVTVIGCSECSKKMRLPIMVIISGITI